MDAEMMSLPGAGAGSSGDIQAVARTAQVLALFGPRRPTVTVAQAAALLGLNRTTTNRYFMSMESVGLLERSPEHAAAFQPSRLIYQLGAFALGRQHVLEVGPPLMRDLAAEARLTVSMALWGASGPVVVHVEQYVTWGATVTVRVGHQLGIDAAQTQVFLAFHPDRFAVERLAGTVPGQQRDGVDERMRATEATGLGLATTPEGVRIIAAPVFGAQGLAATLAVVGTSTVLPAGRSTLAEELLLRTAHAFTDRMGGAWPLPRPQSDPEYDTA
ncbi:IclR family transcriptional regulator [Modestobacter sp. VKM Ac-2978]|uniref:IclR family transcriptional regulator n=1 Tax=Modestobacter sp. VKM Ac-2978 TaxID=3004132 RepID=UPI0022AA3938|nr:helix-turn-helix domain-containing protein [Modestobacter sp. VKM Ac-2978]MCZ2847812.1 helix-turn-helix domain-containing protein [Modestobacter sp. VKM Ac-2978]